jgi:gliding motility-associated-like protein
MLVTPVVPTFSITAPTCSADGFATVTNYDAAMTYVFTPTGPTVDSTGLISGMAFATSYEVLAFNGSCSSANSIQFRVDVILAKPVLVSIVSNTAICTGTSGSLTITATPNSVVTYTIDGGVSQTIAINNTGTASVYTPILNINSTYMVTFVQSTIAPFCGQNQSGSATVIVNPIPMVTITPTATTICSGTSTSIDLSSLVSGTSFSWVVVQQVNASGATNGNGNVISQVLNATLVGNSFVEYSVTPSANGCVGLPQIIRINITPIPNVVPVNINPAFCSGGSTNIQLSSNNVPGAVFSWTVTGGGVVGALGGTGTSINQTLTVSPGTTSIVEVVYTIVAEANGCAGPPQIVRVFVTPIPNVTISPSINPITICSGESTNISFTGTILGTVYNWVITSITGVSGGTNGTGTSIQQVLTASGLSQGSITYQVTPIFNGCTGIPQSVTVLVNPKPELFANPLHPPICSGGIASIPISTFNSNTVFSWIVSPVGVNGATSGTQNGPSITIAQTLTTSGNTPGYVDYIITPTATGCSGAPITVRVDVNPLPEPTLTDGSICVDEFGVPFQYYLLDSGLDDVVYDFVWYFNGVAIPNSNNATYSAGAIGPYGVIATNSSTSCRSNLVTATVGSTSPATSMTLTQTGYFSDNATITVNVSGGSGTLMYSLDDGVLQLSNVFTGVSAGEHIVTVIDTEGCTYMTQEVMVIDYPTYFTPNGDGINDTWNIVGLNQADAKLYIYDRYGKLLKQLSASDTSQGWDGTYNQQLLPSTDYWFTLEYTENGVDKQFKAHFSLNR